MRSTPGASHPPESEKVSGKDTKGLKEHAAHDEMRSRLLRMILQNEEQRKSPAPSSVPPPKK